MKVRVRSCLLVWLVSMVLPIALGALGVSAGPLSPRSAQAQQQPDAVTALARERFLQGVQAYDRGSYEEARSLFLQAYALKRHPAVLLNLGQSELKSGHVAEGGNHLQQFVREHRAATPEQKEAAQRGIAEARARSAHIVVIVDIDGAQVALDGAPVGTSPLLDPVFVAPGKHTATATMSGKTATAQATAKRGTATPVSLSLQALGVVPAAAPVPGPTAAPPATASPPAPAPTTTYPAPPPPGPTATVPPASPMPPPGPQPRTDTGRENFFHWYTRKPVAWVLTGVAGLGLIGTVAFGAAAGSADSAADDVSGAIISEVRRWEDTPTATGHLPDGYYENGDPINGQPQPCGDFEDPSSAYPHYSSACDTLRGNLDDRDTDLALMTVSIVLLAGSVGGTVIYYFVDTADGEDPDRAEGQASITAGPIITPTVQGFGLVGTF